MKNFAGIAGTKFGSEAVMKSEVAFQNFETPPLRSEVQLQNPEVPPLLRLSTVNSVNESQQMKPKPRKSHLTCLNMANVGNFPI